MVKPIGRLITAVTLAFAPLAVVTPALSSAQPLACENGYWWDPVADVCQPPVVPPPLLCENGWWWDPVANVCQPPVVPPPPLCDNGWWWDPVANVCQPPLIPPPE
ncbi:hypothetical protein [Mycobacterium sp. MMS18-G62]